jgi:hypothetical protein
MKDKTDLRDAFYCRIKDKTSLRDASNCSMKDKTGLRDASYCSMKDKTDLREAFHCSVKDKTDLREAFHCSMKDKTGSDPQNRTVYLKGFLYNSIAILFFTHYILCGKVLCMNIKNKLSTRRHGEHREVHHGTPSFLRVLRVEKEVTRRPQRRNFVPQKNESPCSPCLCVEKEVIRRPQRRNFIPQKNESPCSPCLRVDNLFSMSIHKTMPREVHIIHNS